MQDNNHILNRIVEPLLAWYDCCARSLPWRKDRDPYHIWISEIMLQQTRVETVKFYYQRFLNALPDIYALATAPEEQVMKLWEGLGYYSRARNLQKAAQVVVSELGGIIPPDKKELMKLPGVGEYTAGAISSIAFGKAEPAVDGNVLRVTARLLASTDNVSGSEVKKEVSEMIRLVLPSKRAGDFNQALMDLGATVCLPNGAPLCRKCPLEEICDGKRLQVAEKLPIKSKNKERIKEEKTVFIIVCEDKVAFRKRPSRGLLAGMWEFPNVDGVLHQEQVKKQVENWGFHPEKLLKTTQTRHIFTHREWLMSGWFIRVSEKMADTEFVWVNAEKIMDELSVPSAFATFIDILQKGWGSND